MAMKQGELVPQVVEEIKRVEWSNQPVLTTAQLAEFYKCKINNIHDNFRKNHERFIEGKHYFKLKGDELRMFKSEPENFWSVATNCPEIFRSVENTSVLYLWTKRGAARHAKMLNTNKAWEVFEALEDNYFNRPAISDNQPANLECEQLILERDRLNFERKQFKETNTIAKAQLLRELASASKDDVMRNDLVRYAAKLLIGEDFVTKKSCVNKILV